MNADLEFADLVDRYHGPLYRFALSLTGSEADACDLVQQTFYTWARKRGQLRESSKVKSWLFTTLHRNFLQDRRRETRHRHVEFQGAEAELPVLEPQNMASLDGTQVVRLLQNLDSTFQACLALYYLEDYSYEEIASILDVPLGTVKSRLARGIGHLRRLLAMDLAAGGKEHGD